jgi:hypothetical protein
MFRNVATHELFTILIVVSLLFIALAKVLFPKRFHDFVYVIGNSKYLKIYARDQKFFDGFDAMLFVNLILSGAIFLFMAYQNLVADIKISEILMFKLAVGLGVFVLIKILLERLIGSLFEMDRLIDSYLFQKTSYKNLLGILLLPINIILIYSIPPSKNLFYVIIAILIIVNCFGLLTSFKAHQSLIKNNISYFILYLCALEISPYIILYKIII